jgi:2-dehydropantoate 2-reductase
MSDARFAVFGAGGIGGYFAGVLTRAGFPVGLVARGQQLQAIRKDGLRIIGPKDEFTVHLAVATDRPEEIGSVDAVILAVKAWQVPEAAMELKPLLKTGTKVLPFQNGVEAPEQLAKALGPEHALVGLCRIITAIDAPGAIRHAGLQPMVALGEMDGSRLSPNAKGLADALAAAGASVQTPPDIYAALWEKLVFIAAVSGVGAVSRSTIGEFRSCVPSRALLQQSLAEVAAVARARGIRLTADVVPRTLMFVDSLPASGTASMQRDIADGKPSELEAIIGSVVRFGDEAGIATPAMDYMYGSLLPQEVRARGPK